MNTIVKSLVAASLAICVAAPAPAYAWELIGTRKVNSSIDRDVIPVRGQEHFRKIRLCGSMRAIGLLDVKVIFGNGTVQDIGTRATLKPGTCTAAKDLAGDRRNIVSVNIIYTRSPGNPDPVLQVFAR
jgi:hypothetical protein